MTEAVFVFPNQLYQDHPALSRNPAPAWIFLIEDDLFLGDEQYPLSFHQQKIQLHLASMAYYRDYLGSLGLRVCSIEYSASKSALETAYADAVAKNITVILTLEPVDYTLKKRLQRGANSNHVSLTLLPNPGFINVPEENNHYRQNKKRWFMADFYQWQRRRLNILMEGDKPVGGKWSFDGENRKKLPVKQIASIPTVSMASVTGFHQRAIQRLQRDFAHYPGDGSRIVYPVTHEQASHWLDEFLHNRFNLFGPFEDAIVSDQHWLYHSVLTPALNIGLLTPTQVVERALAFANDGDVPLASLEGFIRQVIGWREFMRATYDDLGVAMRNANHWQHQRVIPDSFYRGTSGILPIDDVVKKILQTGYCHHIERLMVLGGFFFLCEFDPDEVYRWFMTMFVDSYDWVMVPNIYGMSQNADGGLITTKPYFSGSNYIYKMSHYKKAAKSPPTKTGTKHWAQVWDGLYWRWIAMRKSELTRNPRWAMMCRQLDKMDPAKLASHISCAENYLARLDWKATGNSL